ncbi:MAG: hypothetical protein MZV64_28225 [Ignavibacteriales bacterium]|nr:hypothetical protein [Ignavibacteriales bacterium]
MRRRARTASPRPARRPPARPQPASAAAARASGHARARRASLQRLPSPGFGSTVITMRVAGAKYVLRHPLDVGGRDRAGSGRTPRRRTPRRRCAARRRGRATLAFCCTVSRPEHVVARELVLRARPVRAPTPARSAAGRAPPTSACSASAGVWPGCTTADGVEEARGAR